MKKTFHWRKIAAPHLQMLLEILKDASGPLTGMEIQLAFQQRGKWAVNPGTDMNELGKNPGYSTSGGVRFPDGKYRYWLTDAPGWAPRWRVTPDFRVVSAAEAEHITTESRSHGEGPGRDGREDSKDDPARTCKFCGASIGQDGPPFCDDEHRRKWFEGVKA